MGGQSRSADDLGSLAGREVKLRDDFRALQPRLNLRPHAAAERFAATVAKLNEVVAGIRWLEVHEQGGVTAPAAASTRGKPDA